jgi:hypothetical protein
MATKKVNIDILAKDKTRQALGSVQKGLANVKGAVFNLRNAFLGLGAGLVARNLVNTGKDIENLRVRLKFLLKDTNEGAKAFDNMAKFASKVPFSLEEISQGSGILATVTDNADDLQKMLQITGNVAATTGLDFRTTAEQIQRSFSAGIGAADLFREKGVRNMLGFQAGATVSIEETVKAFEKVFGEGGRFGNSTDELAKTFEGTLSMIGDKIFSFKKVLLEAGLFEELKNQFGDLDKFLSQNSEQIDKIAVSIGKNLAKAIVGVVDVGKKLTPFFKEVLQFLKNIKDTFFGLPEVIQNIGLIGAVLLGKKGFVGLALILAAIDKANEFGKKFGDKGINVELKPFEHELSGDKSIAERNKLIAETALMIEKAKIKEAELNEEFLKSQQLILDIEHDMSIRVPSATEKAMKKFKEMNDNVLEGFKDKLKNARTIIVEGINTGITNVSEGLARALLFGEKLTDTFKKMAQELAVRVLSTIIEIIARKGVELALEKLITREKLKQASISKASTFGSAFSFIGGFLGFADGGRPPVGRPSIVGERGPELFVPDQAGTVVPNNQLGMSKAVTVNFNINTVDARGFNELLVNSRGVIVNMINSAVNEKGKAALI